MDKRIRMSQEEMHNYFIREQKVMQYGIEFFRDLCRNSISTDTCIMVNDKVIPLSCFNIMDEYLYSIDNDLDYAVQGGFVSAGKRQAYIRIGIDASNSILNKRLKRTIRHEIIHYYLWVLGLPYADDSLEFWCLCYVYDSGAYEKINYSNEKYYKLFVDLFDSYVADLPCNVKHILTGQMIAGISKTPIEEYKDFVVDMVNKMKKLYSLI